MVHAIVALHALGKAEILTPLIRLTPAQGRAFAASLYLILARAKPVARSILAELVWPGIADSPRQHRLRQMLLQLKHSGIPLVTTRETVTLPAQRCSSDLDVLFIHGAGDVDSFESLQFLPGYAPLYSREYSDWLDSKRMEVSAAACRLLLNEIKRARSRGDWLKIERLALKCIDVDPFNEEAVLARAEASAMRGSKHEAVAILDRYVADLGPGTADIKLPANLMRKRIAERVSEVAFSDRTQGIFVGREADMQALTVILDDARAGRGRCCVIWGEPGIGKTRLASELGRFAELQGVQVRKVACRRGDTHRPLSVFVEAVPMLREMRGALGCSPDTLADLRRLTQFDIGSAKQAVELDPQSIFELIRLAIFDLIDAVQEEQCLILIVEDVQWLDPASARILGQIADWAAKKQVLLLFTSRSRENPVLDACTRSGLFTHHLRPLTEEAATALVSEMFEATNEVRDEEFLGWCRGVGDGNPFFLHELVKQWLETKQRHSIPPSITAVIRDRFSRLTPESTQLLQACSVLGENSTLPRVEKMLQQEPYMLLGALNELSRTSMLSAERKRSGSSPDFKLAPRHDLVAKVALEALDPHGEVYLHRRAAETLESELEGENQDTALLWGCARHWQKAGENTRALDTAVRWASQLLRVGLPLEAADAYHRARAFSTELSQTESLVAMEIDALERAQAWSQLKEVVLKSRGAATGDDVHDDLELQYLFALWRTSGDSAELAQRVLTCAKSQAATDLHRVQAGCMAMKISSNASDWEQFETSYSSIQTILASGSVPEEARLEVELIFHTMRGDLGEASSLASRFVASLKSNTNVNKLARAHTNTADVYRLVGDLDKARGLLEHAAEFARAHRCYDIARLVTLEIVRLSLSEGHILQAREEWDRSDLSGVLEDPIAAITYQTMEARLLIEENRLEEAHTACTGLLIKSPRLPVTRRALILGAAVRLAVKSKSDHSELSPLVAALEEIHLTHRGTGWQDYEAYSLYLGLCALGYRTKATDLLSEYVNSFRRDISTLPTEIARAINTKRSKSKSVKQD